MTRLVDLQTPTAGRHASLAGPRSKHVFWRFFFHLCPPSLLVFVVDETFDFAVFLLLFLTQSITRPKERRRFSNCADERERAHLFKLATQQLPAERDSCLLSHATHTHTLRRTNTHTHTHLMSHAGAGVWVKGGSRGETTILNRVIDSAATNPRELDWKSFARPRPLRVGKTPLHLSGWPSTRANRRGALPRCHGAGGQNDPANTAAGGGAYYLISKTAFI